MYRGEPEQSPQRRLLDTQRLDAPDGQTRHAPLGEPGLGLEPIAHPAGGEAEVARDHHGDRRGDDHQQPREPHGDQGGQGKPGQRVGRIARDSAEELSELRDDAHARGHRDEYGVGREPGRQQPPEGQTVLEVARSRRLLRLPEHPSQVAHPAERVCPDERGSRTAKSSPAVARRADRPDAGCRRPARWSRARASAAGPRAAARRARAGSSRSGPPPRPNRLRPSAPRRRRVRAGATCRSARMSMPWTRASGMARRFLTSHPSMTIRSWSPTTRSGSTPS